MNPIALSAYCSPEVEKLTTELPTVIVITLNDLGKAMGGIDFWSAFASFEYAPERYCFTLEQLKAAITLSPRPWWTASAQAVLFDALALPKVRIETIRAQISDYHKDLHGFRPRQLDLNDPAALQCAWDQLCAYHRQLESTVAGRATLRSQGWCVPPETS